MGRGWSTARRFATRFPDFGHTNAYCGPMVSQWNSEYGLVVSIGLVLAFLFTVDGLRSVRSRLPKKLPVVANALLSRAEQVLYGRLVRAFPGHVVLAQVALSQLLTVDRAQAVDLAVRVAEKAKAAVWVSPFSARCSFPERHPQFAGFLHASPGQLSSALRDHDVVVVIGAPVFTFHVEGHAEIFDGTTALFQITDDPTAAAVTPHGTSIIATMKPALGMLMDLLPDTQRAVPKGRVLPPAPPAAEPIPVEYLLHALSVAMPDDAVLVEEAPSHRPAMQKFMPMRGQDSFCTMASGGLGFGLPAAVGTALGRPGVRTVCLIGDGSAMYSIQALWTAAQRKLPLTVVVINNSGYGAMRSFSQVMQVRNVPGLDLPGIDFVAIAQGMGCDAVRVSQSSELAGALKRGLAFEGTSLIEVMVDSAVPLLYAHKN